MKSSPPICLALLGLTFAQPAFTTSHYDGSLKPRIIVLSDITTPDWEPDDMQSLIHLLSAADLFEIEALISTSGWSIPPRPLEPFNFYDVIDRYSQDLPNLMKRSDQKGFAADESAQEIGYWPSPGYLESIIRHGFPERGMTSVGDGKATNGSNFIIDILDQDDPRPVYIGVWGGGNILAQSIWDVRRTRSPAEVSLFLSKMRIYAITDQDTERDGSYNNSAQLWMRETFPELFYIHSESVWHTYGNTIRDTYWNGTYTREIQGQGALGDKYPTWRYTVEGDSPSYLYVWPGLNDPEDPRQASFGGKFVREMIADNQTVEWTDTSDAAARRSEEAMLRTLPDQINDFIARMAWAAEGRGNRNPIVVLHGNSGLGPVTLTAKPGDIVRLATSGTWDPDGDGLTYEWWHDEGAGGYFGSLDVKTEGPGSFKVYIPKDAKGKQVHVVVRVVDDGEPPLASYRRTIIDIQ